MACLSEADRSRCQVLPEKGKFPLLQLRTEVTERPSIPSEGIESTLGFSQQRGLRPSDLPLDASIRTSLEIEVVHDILLGHTSAIKHSHIPLNNIGIGLWVRDDLRTRTPVN